MARRIGYCTCCDQWRTQYGHLNLCSACYTRWLDHGKPAVCPPPAKPARTFTPESREKGCRVKREARAARIEDYLWLLTQGHSRETAAAQIGVAVATAERYERETRHQGVPV